MKQIDISKGQIPDAKQISGTNLMTKKQKEELLKELQTQPVVADKPVNQKAQYINDDSKVNFQNWVLILVSFSSMILTATLIYQGLSASSLTEHSMYADKALVLLGALTCIINMITIFASHFNKKRTLLLVVYLDFVMIVYLLVYAFGCITFKPNMQQWVYTNWEALQNKVQKQTFVEFQQEIENQIISLGVTALTLSIGFIISITIIFIRIHLKKILLTFVPAFALMFIVLGSGLLYLTIYALVHLDFIDIPFWMNTVSLCLAGVLILIGTIGYFASLYQMRKLTIFYLTCVSIISLSILVCCIGYIILSSKINMYVEQHWPQIRDQLDRAGIWMPRSTFTSGLILNIKFSGLYGISFFLFLAIGLAGSIYHVSSW